MYRIEQTDEYVQIVDEQGVCKMRQFAPTEEGAEIMEGICRRMNGEDTDG